MMSNFTSVSIMPSKKLAKEDATEVLLVQEALDQDPTYGVNVERVLHHSDMGWVVFEFLKLGDPFSDPPYKWRDRMDIHQSHPNKYWDNNGRKFVSLWQLTQALDGELFLVNYSVREADTEDDVPDDCISQPYVRIPPGSNQEEEVYYYIAKDKGAHVMRVTNIDLTADFDDSSANPISTDAHSMSADGMDWDDFSDWFRKLNRESDGDPRKI